MNDDEEEPNDVMYDRLGKALIVALFLFFDVIEFGSTHRPLCFIVAVTGIGGVILLGKKLDSWQIALAALLAGICATAVYYGVPPTLPD